MKRCLFLTVIVLFLLSSCASATPPNPAIKGLADTINRTRTGVNGNDWTSDELERFQAYATFDKAEALDWEGLTTKPINTSYRLSGTEACEDVATLFSALRAAYGGYGYFGGDKIFNKIQAAATDDILALTSRGTSMRKNQLKSILISHLSDTVVDGHFSIDETLLIGDGRSFMYYVPALFFDTPDLATGIPDSYVQPTITASGQLAYGLYALSADGTDLPTSGVISGKETPLNWEKAANYVPENSSIYSRQLQSGIPILNLPSFSPSNDEELTRLTEFAATGAEEKQSPMLILDLRGNGGGNTDYPYLWLKNYLGVDTCPKSIRATRYTGFWLKTMEQLGASDAAIKEVREREGECVATGSSLHITPNSNIIFVLTDKHTASAAESFIRQLQTVENVIVVGSNTSGSNSFGNVGTLYLPHSGYEVKFGATVSLWSSLDHAEGRGILPDLWVPPDEALDCVLALAKGNCS